MLLLHDGRAQLHVLYNFIREYIKTIQKHFQIDSFVTYSVNYEIKLLLYLYNC